MKLGLVDRRLRARDQLAAQIMHYADLDAQTAHRVINLYCRERIARFDGMRYVVKHGAFLGRDVLQRAAEQVA